MDVKRKDMNSEYQYIEDSGGNLFLFIFNGHAELVRGIENLEYAQPGEWAIVKDAMAHDAQWATADWDGQMALATARAVYDWLRDDNTSRVVADECGIYAQQMGRAAERYFGVNNW